MLASVWQSLIVCDPTHADNLPDCDYAALIHLIKNAISDLVVLSTLATVFACIFIGFKLVVSQGNPSAMKDAQSRARAILTGYFFILAAWVIVYAIASVLFQDSYFNTVLTK
jgi:formate/nitrite transporter FocA (FNT family)